MLQVQPGKQKMPKVPVHNHTHTRHPNKCVYMTRDPQNETKISRIFDQIIVVSRKLSAFSSDVKIRGSNAGLRAPESRANRASGRQN